MTVTRTVKVEAEDPKSGMTLDEIATFVSETQGLATGTQVRAIVNLRGGIKRLETKA